MKCFVCRFGEIEPGVTTYNLNHDPMTLVVKNVPASVCDACGEGHLEPEVSVRLQEIVNEARTAGVEFMVRKYTPARTPHKANGVQRQPVEEFLAKLSLSINQYTKKEHSNGFRLYVNASSRPRRFGFVRLNKSGRHANKLVVYANGDFRDPENRFTSQPKKPRDAYYRFRPDNEGAMNYAAHVVRSAYDSKV